MIVYLKKIIKAVIPYGIIIFYRYCKAQKQNRLLYGKKCYCPVCKKKSFFRPVGVPLRQKAQCPNCGSLERHRTAYVFLSKFTDIFEHQKKILHIAAEPCLEEQIRNLHGDNYITADLYNQNAMIKMDITNIQYPDETFDIIICNHVLEHITDDIKAMTELYRVLKKNSWAVLDVPVYDLDKTYEDYSITNEAERLAAFGQEDHVRKYGRDYSDRLRSVGFTVKTFKADEVVSRKKKRQMDLKGQIYCAYKSG